MSKFKEHVGGLPPLSAAEEALNSLTHGAGFFLSLAAAAGMLALCQTADWGLSAACGAYVLSLIAVYAFSTLSHAIHHPPVRHWMRAWDQGVIYLLIAGTYTPFIWAYLADGMRSLMLVVVWGLALVGFYSKVVARRRADLTATITYVLLGWGPALYLVNYVTRSCLVWMALGGVLYTLGTLFLHYDRRVRFFHAVWHLLVILASAVHYYAIVTFIVLKNEA